MIRRFALAACLTGLATVALAGPKDDAAEALKAGRYSEAIILLDRLPASQQTFATRYNAAWAAYRSSSYALAEERLTRIRASMKLSTSEEDSVRSLVQAIERK